MRVSPKHKVVTVWHLCAKINQIWLHISNNNIINYSLQN